MVHWAWLILAVMAGGSVGVAIMSMLIIAKEADGSDA